MIDSTTKNRALGFLVWFRKFYNGSTDKTYQQMEKDYPQCNYGTIRVYLMELVDKGYLTVENPGKHIRRYIVNEEKYKEVFY